MPRSFWGGFCDDRLDLRRVNSGFGGIQSDGWVTWPAIFTSKKAARQQYEDVRKIEIRVLKRALRGD
jgi:hypothetical protein